MRSNKTVHAIASAAALLAIPAVATAQDGAQDGNSETRAETISQAGPPPGMMGPTVFDGDYVTLGLGVGLSASYTGSNDYVISPLPLVFGSFKGVDIDPRPAGLALDFIPDGEPASNSVNFALGPVARLRSDRNNQIADDVVRSLGKLDRAIEVGVSAGVQKPGILHRFDSLSVSADVLWDVNGAHGGNVISPQITYFTPLSLGIAASLSLSADYADGDFHDYYFAVSPAQELATAGAVTAFDPDGGGLVSVGSTLLVGFDLDGDARNGGWGVVTILGYSRVLGDARRTPLTSVRGSANQGFLALGVGYTF